MDGKVNDQGFPAKEALHLLFHRLPVGAVVLLQDLFLLPVRKVAGDFGKKGPARKGAVEIDQKPGGFGSDQRRLQRRGQPPCKGQGPDIVSPVRREEFFLVAEKVAVGFRHPVPAVFTGEDRADPLSQ
jgi:hypothetical protein